MKKILYILTFLFTLQTSFAQNEQPGEVKVREKMIGYIQNKLGLNRVEAEKFQPLFVNYLKELRRTNKEFKGQNLEQQQKLLEVRMRYRDQFKPVIGEKRSNDVFDHEKEFIKTIRQEINIRRQDRLEHRTDKRKNTEMLLEN
ncbi:MAG TPA: hypothetical protein VM871_00955 [Flavisolibacter sp.]|nr:hypothetical protein [Flavisolibacter sp.]